LFWWQKIYVFWNYYYRHARISSNRHGVSSVDPRDNWSRIATGYRLHNRWFGVPFPEGSTIFSSPRRPRQFWGPPTFLISWYWRFITTGVNRLGREADNSPPTSVKFKETQIYISTPPIRLDGVARSQLSTGRTLPCRGDTHPHQVSLQYSNSCHTPYPCDSSPCQHVNISCGQSHSLLMRSMGKWYWRLVNLVFHISPYVAVVAARRPWTGSRLSYCSSSTWDVILLSYS
jgi:hypothetical protein